MKMGRDWPVMAIYHSLRKQTVVAEWPTSQTKLPVSREKSLHMQHLRGQKNERQDGDVVLLTE
jgi:hypothetical protein